MWVWTPEDPARLVDWATRHGVTTMFVYVDPATPATADPATPAAGDPATPATADPATPAAGGRGADVERLRELKRRCDEAGITLDALGGEPAWAIDHAAALDWRDAVDRLGLFHGKHLDVEPYLLPAWTTDRAAIVRSFLELLDRMGGSGPLEVDIPFWYGDLAGDVLARVDAVTVMSYRDTASAIIEVGSDTLGRATKPVRLAAETRPTPDCARCSFHGTSQRHLAAVLAETERAVRAAQAPRAARRFPAYAGIAIHDYAAWSALPG